MKINDPALFSTEIERIRELVERGLEIVWLDFFSIEKLLSLLISFFVLFLLSCVSDSIWPRFNERLNSVYLQTSEYFTCSY